VPAPTRLPTPSSTNKTGSRIIDPTNTGRVIALANAVNVRCDGCISFHVNDALKAGATCEEIIESLGVAIMRGGGPTLMYSVEALEVLNQFETELVPV